MNSIVKEGLIIGIYGMSITFAVLALLGFVLFMFKFIFKKTVNEGEEKGPDIVSFEEPIPEGTQEKKKFMAIAVALSQFLSSRTKKAKGETKHASSKKDINKTIKEKRWKNG